MAPTTMSRLVAMQNDLCYHNCYQNGLCDPQTGICTCAAGYEATASACTQIDECAAGTEWTGGDPADVIGATPADGGHVDGGGCGCVGGGVY